MVLRFLTVHAPHLALVFDIHHKRLALLEFFDSKYSPWLELEDTAGHIVR